MVADGVAQCSLERKGFTMDVCHSERSEESIHSPMRDITFVAIDSSLRSE
jgi:hypothetical protein